MRTCSQDESCPACGENRKDYLAWKNDTTLQCESCGAIYEIGSMLTHHSENGITVAVWSMADEHSFMIYGETLERRKLGAHEACWVGELRCDLQWADVASLCRVLCSTNGNWTGDQMSKAIEAMTGRSCRLRDVGAKRDRAKAAEQG